MNDNSHAIEEWAQGHHRRCKKNHERRLLVVFSFVHIQKWAKGMIDELFDIRVKRNRLWNKILRNYGLAAAVGNIQMSCQPASQVDC